VSTYELGEAAKYAEPCYLNLAVKQLKRRTRPRNEASCRLYDLFERDSIANHVMELLSGLLSLPLISGQKQELAAQLWNSTNLPGHPSEIFSSESSYFDYYQAQCIASTKDPNNNCGVSTHLDVVNIVHLLRERNATRLSVKDSLMTTLSRSGSTHFEEALQKAINLVIRLWLMIDVGDYMNGIIPGQTRLCWADDSLQNLVKSEFINEPILQSKLKLEKTFMAFNLERVAGIKIFWTDNLADHLRMMDDDTRVAVFHHAFFLHCHKKWYAKLGSCVDITSFPTID
jgi:hypothetical protein